MSTHGWHFYLVTPAALAALAGCADARAQPAPLAHSEELHPETSAPRRVELTGAAFPERVLALTWDDGPDLGTLRLASYLHDHRVAATFFVVREWIAGTSDEPGVGPVDRTGYAHLPILGDLVRLGHRLGGHTRNHVLLSEVPTAEVAAQLAGGATDLAPFVTNDLSLFRAPGGAWSPEAASVMTEPPLTDLAGPVRWDIDAKDWDASLYCRDSPPDECEPGPIPGERRVRPRVVAARYLAQIEARRQGIVLLHDRVGDVGSGYALALAETLVPELERRGFVFAAPVLAFGPLRPRPGAAVGAATRGDLNGDGRDDECTATERGVECRLAAKDGLLAPTIWAAPIPAGATLRLGDVNGDGRADACVEPTQGGGELRCGLAP